uniref:Bm1209 n=1 Tax=Brugia malayi TaxID=6279 RepID=A0A0J9Y7T2_BRUMA|nr:Bm1209 [Brugia malayi]
MTSINAARAENRQMVNMDIEAIARIEAATKALNVTKNKGYDDIIISESKSFSGSKKEISQKKDNKCDAKKRKTHHNNDMKKQKKQLYCPQRRQTTNIQVQGQRRKIIEEKDVVVVVPFHEIIIIYE